MNTFDLLKDFKSKIEASAQIEESPVVVSEINGAKNEATAVVMKEIEGKVRMIRLQATIIGEAITA